MNARRIEGAVALVTGANRGIGRALTEALLTRGVRKVYATARNPEALRDGRSARRTSSADPRQIVRGPLETHACAYRHGERERERTIGRFIIRLNQLLWCRRRAYDPTIALSLLVAFVSETPPASRRRNRRI